MRNKRQRRFKLGVIIVFSCLWIWGAFVGWRNLNVNHNTTSEADTSQSTKLKKITIGYQKGDILEITKVHGNLDADMKEKGYRIVWRSFQSGAALLQALATGNLDFGRTGNTPPITSQAAGTDVVYVGAGYSKYNGSGILIPNSSSMTSVKDLAGKSIAVNKGSSAHYLLVRALESVGLSIDDVKLVYLDPSAARIAFTQGKVDAWAIWDPYTADAQINADAKLLVSGKNYTTDRDFILSTRAFTNKHADLTSTVVDGVAIALDWANDNKSELSNQLQKSLKLDKEVTDLTVSRRTYGVSKLSQKIIQEQQEIADLWYRLGYIDKKIDVDKNVVGD